MRPIEAVLLVVAVALWIVAAALLFVTARGDRLLTCAFGWA